jgi:hypothetical protein
MDALPSRDNGIQ